MSTHSAIAIKEDNKITSIYCHFDGYLEHNGVTLFEHYQDVDKIKSLIALGDISSLKESLEPTSDTHSFMNREEGVTVAYHRDRGEDWELVKPLISDCYRELMRKYGVYYYYIYDTDQKMWHVIRGTQDEPINLHTVLKELEEREEE